MACHEPEESCFCKVFGTDAADPEADADVKGIADVAAWMVEGSLYWKALTEKGEALTEAVKELLIPADDDQVKVDAEKEAIQSHCGKTSIYPSFPGRLGWKRHR